MNKIFKKIWNQSRGCFVAVSEAMTSACQNSGKTAVILSGLLSLSNVYALTTVNGNIELGNLREDTKRTLVDSYVINGNATANVAELNISWTSKNYRDMENQSLQVNGNLDSNCPLFVIAHRGDGASRLSGALSVQGNLNLHSGLLRVGSGNSNSGGVVTSSLNVGGTINIASGATLDNRPDYHHVQFQLNAGAIDSSGVFDISSVESGAANVGYLTVRGGNFRQASSVQTYVANSIALLGGTLNNQDSLYVGGKNGNFSVENTLTLAGGVLGNRTLLTQAGGTVNVSAGSYDFTTLNKSNGTLNNQSVLSIVNFNQSNGSTNNNGKLTIGNTNLFGSLNNTDTLTLTGNVTSRGNLTNSGNLNNRGSWTETNRFTIAGNLNNSGFANFQNGFQFGNGRLTSSGTIQTNNAFDVFDSLGTTGQQDLHYVALNSTVPQEAKTSLTDFFLKYVPGTVAKTLADHASFTGGKVIVTGVNLTQTQAADLTKAFKEQFFRLSPKVSTSAVLRQC